MHRRDNSHPLRMWADSRQTSAQRQMQILLSGTGEYKIYFFLHKNPQILN